MRLITRSTQPPVAIESDIQNSCISKENFDLELVPTEQSDQCINARIHSILPQIGKSLKTTIAILTKEPEVEIWQKKDRNGHTHWYAYDPHAGKSISFASELEMLGWLDNQNSRW